MDLPETALIIEKLNEEFDELQQEFDELQQENDKLKQEIVLLKNKYESNEKDVNQAIKDCIRFNGAHNDMATLLYILYKGKFKCTSICNKTWYYLDDYNKWKLSVDSNIEIRTAISGLEEIFINEVKKYKEFFDNFTGDDAEEYSNNIYDYEKCNEIIDKFRKRKKNYILKECMELFYDDKFLCKLDTM
jgi:chromosome segregation ATPase